MPTYYVTLPFGREVRVEWFAGLRGFSQQWVGEVNADGWWFEYRGVYVSYTRFTPRFWGEHDDEPDTKNIPSGTGDCSVAAVGPHVGEEGIACGRGAYRGCTETPTWVNANGDTGNNTPHRPTPVETECDVLPGSPWGVIESDETAPSAPQLNVPHR
jgi:hypothetical protein